MAGPRHDERHADAAFECGALAAAQRRPDVPRDLDPSDLDHPLGKLLAALHGAAVFDVRDTPAFASANRSADRESPLDDDEIYEELLRQQLLDEPRAAAYRSWRRGSTPSDEDDFAWLVADMLLGNVTPASLRTEQRRFRWVTGLTQSLAYQISRARRAAFHLQRGWSADAVIESAGYYDQAHLNRAMRRWIGRTPGEIAHGMAQLSFLYNTPARPAC